MTADLVIRTARKAHRCANASRKARGLEWTAHCKSVIEKGGRYAEGDMNPDEAGGFGHYRHCMSCAERGLL